jgi:hypothetical protein
VIETCSVPREASLGGLDQNVRHGPENVISVGNGVTTIQEATVIDRRYRGRALGDDHDESPRLTRPGKESWLMGSHRPDEFSGATQLD